MTRREQWIRFYEAALAGTADPRISEGEVLNAERSATWNAEQAERVANAAMARLDAREFPEPKVRALLLAARNAWKSASHKDGVAMVPSQLLATLGAAIADFTGDE